MKIPMWPILFYAFILCWKETDEFIVKSSSTFPILVNEIFKLEIMRINGIENLSNFTGDTMVIQISDNSESVKEKNIFNYGLLDSIDNEFHGTYFNIKKWSINSNSSAIDISIVFKKNSNLHILEIFIISTSSKQIRKMMLNNLKLSKRIYRNTISLLSPSKIDLTFVSNKGTDENWRIGDVVTVTCRAYDGLPAEIPKFENYQALSVLDSSFSRERNERQIKFTIRLIDHLKQIKCYSGNSFKYFVVKVLHPPTQLYIQPNISKTIQVDSNILCFVKDGHPSPNIDWIYLEGPINSSQFFQMNENRSEILIMSNCPIRSKWKFECRVIYNFGTTHKTIKKMISFVVIESNPNSNDFDDRLLNLENQIKNISENFHKEKLNLVKVQQNLQNEIKKIENKCKCFGNNIDEYKSKLNSENFQQIIKIEIKKINFKLNDLNITNRFEFDSFKTTQNFQFNLLRRNLENLTTEIDDIKRNNKRELLNVNQKLIQIENMLKIAPLKIESNNTKCKNLPFIGLIRNKGENREINEWIINDFQILKDLNDEIFSPSFYSFTKGFQIRLNMIPKGQTSSDDIFMSLFFQIVPGEYDNELSWPIKSEIKLSIKNQLTGNLYLQTKFSLKINKKHDFVFNKPKCNGSEFLGIPSYAPLSFLEKYELTNNDNVIIVCEVMKNID